jgi:methylmalonyl-CoA mutase N-terminal domain/subunit
MPRSTTRATSASRATIRSRGVHATGYRGAGRCACSPVSTAEETNARFRYLLSQGQTGLSIAFDLPTLMGYDTDAPEAAGEFGKCGVAVSSLADMEALLDGIPLADVTTSMTINSPAAAIWAMYIVAAEKQGVPRARLGGAAERHLKSSSHEVHLSTARIDALVIDTVQFGTREMPL